MLGGSPTFHGKDVADQVLDRRGGLTLLWHWMNRGRLYVGDLFSERA